MVLNLYNAATRRVATRRGAREVADRLYDDLRPHLIARYPSFVTPAHESSARQ